MNITAVFSNWAQAAGGAVVVMYCIFAYGAMGRGTRHCIRFVYGVMGVAGLGLAALPFAPAHLGVRIWLHDALVLALAAYLWLDRRRVGSNRRAP